MLRIIRLHIKQFASEGIEFMIQHSYHAHPSLKYRVLIVKLLKMVGRNVKLASQDTILKIPPQLNV